MAKIPRLERLLNLLSFLLRARAPVAWADIKGRVVGYDDDASHETLERRFERDKGELRALGFPIEYTAGDEHGNDGYRIPKVDVFLPTLELAPADAAVLALVGRVAAPGLPPDLAEHLASAIRKLAFMALDHEGPDAQEGEQLLFAAEPGPHAAAGPPHLDVVVEAVAQRRSVQFEYYAISHDRAQQRLVDPYGVGFYGGHWYLVARDRERDQVRSFRLDRIRSQPAPLSEATEEGDFEPPVDFRLSDHLGRQAWELPEPRPGVEPVEATIRIDSTMAWMVREHPPRDSQIEATPDGGVRLSVRTERPEALVRWVLRHTVHAVVEEPPWLRQRCADAARHIAALYGEAGHG